MVAITLDVTVETTVLCRAVQSASYRSYKKGMEEGGLTVASSTTVETADSVTVTVDVVAVDKKQLQALLIRPSLDEHCDTMSSAGTTAEMVGARFWNTVVGEPVVLQWWLLVDFPQSSGT